MVSQQPIFCFKYFKIKRNELPKGTSSLFYLSWEDALWDILKHKKIKSNSNIFIPEFYCGDVEKNIKEHGYKICYYKINSNLSVDKKSFVKGIKKYNPTVVIVFHPVGIKSNLFKNPAWLIKNIGDALLIEDSVHRTIDPTEFKIFNKNHFIVDSLRKVVPIQGSRVYGSKRGLDFLEPPIYQSIFYSLHVHWLWIIMTLLWTIANYCPIEKISAIFARLAERVMLSGYDVIGDSKLSARGNSIGKIMSLHIDVSKIKKRKVIQANLYEKEFGNIFFNKVKLSISDKEHLRGYPFILPIGKADKILCDLRKNKLLTRFELNDSNWSKKQKIIYLPMHIFMSAKQQKKVVEVVSNTVKAFNI